MSPNSQNDVFVPHPERLAISKLNIRRGGVNKFHVLADFDNTLTRAFVNGEKAPSIIGQLRKDNYLTPDYPAQAQALYDHYAPIERDQSLSLAERSAAMLTWWKTHFALLEKSGFSKDVIEDVVVHSTLQFREELEPFIDFLEHYDIPLIIMSAAPGDMLTEHLLHVGLLRKNVYVIANLYEFDHDGNAVKVKEPIIHSLNKNEIVLQNFPIFEKVRARTNVLLLGDSLGDVGMVEGFDYHELIKVGFLNQHQANDMALYSENYDIILTNDGSMEPVNELLAELFE